MSGGSYWYLFAKEIGEIIENPAQLENMSMRLDELDAESKAAIDTREMLAKIKNFRDEMKERKKVLENVWHAVEWLDSADWGESEVKRSLSEYEKG